MPKLWEGRKKDCGGRGDFGRSVIEVCIIVHTLFLPKRIKKKK
jgi:hypothetical protein